MEGILWSVAASTMQAVLGPKHKRSTMALRRWTVAFKSNGVSLMAAITRSRAAMKLARPTSSWRVRMTTL